jgi:hypothetical protein
MEHKKTDRKWNLKEQAEIAKNSFNERPEWVKSISHFSGTNTSPSTTESEKSKNTADGDKK